MWAENLYLVKSSPRSVSKRLQFFELDRFAQINSALCCQVEHAIPVKTYAYVRFPSNKVKITLLQKLLSSYVYDHAIP